MLIPATLAFFYKFTPEDFPNGLEPGTPLQKSHDVPVFNNTAEVCSVALGLRIFYEKKLLIKNDHETRIT